MPVPIVAIPPARSTNHRYPRTLFDTYRIHLSGAREPLLHMILEFGQAPMHYASQPRNIRKASLFDIGHIALILKKYRK